MVPGFLTICVVTCASLGQVDEQVSADEIFARALEAEGRVGIVEGEIRVTTDAFLPGVAPFVEEFTFVCAQENRFELRYGRDKDEVKVSDGTRVAVYTSAFLKGGTRRVGQAVELYPERALWDTDEDLYYEALRGYQDLRLMMEPLHYLDETRYETLADLHFEIQESTSDEIILAANVGDDSTITLRLDPKLEYRLLEYRFEYLDWTTSYHFSDFKRIEEGIWLPQTFKEEQNDKVPIDAITFRRKSVVTNLTANSRDEAELFVVVIPENALVVDYSKFGHYVKWLLAYYDLSVPSEIAEAFGALTHAYPIRVYLVCIALLGLLAVWVAIFVRRILRRRSLNA